MIFDLKNGLLIVVCFNIFMCKLFGGVYMNFESKVLCFDGEVFFGFFVVGEVFGFGGGGYYGYNVFEGIFFGGCIFFGW